MLEGDKVTCKRSFNWSSVLTQAEAMIYSLRFAPVESHDRHILRHLLMNLAAALEMECNEHERDLRTLQFWADSYIKEHGYWGECSWKSKYEKLQERLSQRAGGTAHTTGCFLTEKDGVCTCGADMQTLLKSQQETSLKLRDVRMKLREFASTLI